MSRSTFLGGGGWEVGGDGAPARPNLLDLE
jgi:hypothetical protein